MDLPVFCFSFQRFRPGLSHLTASGSTLYPGRCTYFPWSDGPQNCLGAKFAQVEFVAILACLLQDHRVGIVHEPNESSESARKRALATTQDCGQELILGMRNPDKVRLAWKWV